MAALSIATTWNKVEFGGVISIGGPIPDHFPLPEQPNIRTPTLVMGGELGDVNATAKARIKSMVMHVDVYLEDGITDHLPNTPNEITILQEFFTHRLRKTEWMQPSVLTLDGGGIRGYGTLLILRELMKKIGKLERELDPNTKSSFHPSEYKPRRSITSNGQAGVPGVSNGTRPELQRDHSSRPVATPIDGLAGSDLFLPCHYFTYIGGTSTGGLISIMLSRLRMSVEDCIKEYKDLGSKVFGHPRPFPNKGVVWHKFDSKKLHAVIEEVVQQHHTKTNQIRHTYPSHEDFCQTVVVAYTNERTATTPYLFRTYRAFDYVDRRNTQTPIRNPGDPQSLEIPIIGRATSAAPGYFRPVEIPTNGSNGYRKTISFKDGGFGCNNPSNEVRRDIKCRHGDRNENLGPFVSVGTGQQEDVDMFPRDGAFKHIRHFVKNVKTVISLPPLTEGAHLSMRDAAFDGNRVIFPYFRFDGGPRLGKLPMDSWSGHKFTRITGRDSTSGCKTLEEIEIAVTMYLKDDPDANNDLDKAAKLLVQRRRLRTRDKSAWDRYACASWYQCPFGDCKDKRRHETSIDFKNHVIRDHKFQVDTDVLEAQLVKSRHCWLYGENQNTPTATKSEGKKATS
jgi:hypothetical protein